MHIAIVGRQPDLGVAELERIYGADNVTAIFSSDAVLIDGDCSAGDLQRMGGSVKLATVLTTINSTKWHDIEKQLGKCVSEHLGALPEGKFRYGVSVYGIDIRVEAINAATLRLKKIVKAAGRSGRAVPNKAPALNSAQVIHNQLTSPIGAEFLVVRQGNTSIIARTIAEQDIDAYAARDQARPARDAFVGMLPPKLAQVMINLAYPSSDVTDGKAVILDPFCGTGVVLQEAALMGYDVYGTDYAEKMIRFSTKNLEWLKEKFGTDFNYILEEADAMNAQWQPFNAVACETYLGQPFSATPSPSKLEEVMQNCDHIISEFMRNVGSQIPSGTPLCLGVPAWRGDNGWITHLPLIKKLDQLGYRQIEFKNIDPKNLLYYRPDQIVARELLVLEKI
jgi:SAM-dependent methyltransferase